MNTNDPIDRLLREDAARELADDGFSARVLRALPPAPRPATWKFFLILGSAALGCLLAMVLAPSDASLLAGFIDISAKRFATPAAIGALATASALALTGFIVAQTE